MFAYVHNQDYVQTIYGHENSWLSVWIDNLYVDHLTKNQNFDGGSQGGCTYSCMLFLSIFLIFVDRVSVSMQPCKLYLFSHTALLLIFLCSPLGELLFEYQIIISVFL